MKTRIFNAVGFAALMLPPPLLQAQTTIDESFHANGSIRVVVAVAGIVLTGLFAYMFWLDRRLNRLENRNKNK